MKKQKKAQEEIVGFVVVVVIVAIIFLVFLGISTRRESPATRKDSGDVSQFLASAMEYTSSCAIVSDFAYINLGNVIRECYSNSKCRSEEDACHVLNRTLQEVIDSNWKIGADRPIKGYIFNATYRSESRAETFIIVSKGTCTSERIGAEYLMPAYPGNIRSSLEMCS